MRLIDANNTYKELIDNIDWLREQDYETYSTIGDDIRTILDKQPMILDIDKIVEQLKEKELSYYLTIANTGDKNLDFVYEKIANAIDEIIEIVKGGRIK